MKEPTFLTLDEVMALHFDQIDRYGGSTGIRDLALLESALAAPKARLAEAFLHPTIEEMAAAYLFHLLKNHPFVDGNKRTGLAAAIAFLGLNDFYLVSNEDALVELVMSLADGRAGKPEASLFIRARLEAFDP